MDQWRIEIPNSDMFFFCIEIPHNDFITLIGIDMPP